MRVIAIEEHFSTSGIRAAAGRRGAGLAGTVALLDDLGEQRIAGMDAAGIDLQVLSVNPPATQQLEPAVAVPLAMRTNDHLAAAIAAHPDRFAGFATLPTADPEAAATELERAVTDLGFKGAMVHGHTHGRFLDDQTFWPFLQRAESLGVPVYLHPTFPAQQVMEAYYGGFDAAVSEVLATAGWGWHAETGLHALRMVVGGVFDRFPGLRVIIGHMGEHIPFSLARADERLSPVAGHLERRVAEYFQQNFYITTSGYFTDPPLECALAVLGADRIIFSVDYPFSDNTAARAFLDRAPLSRADREKIAHGNAERLLGL